MLKRLLRQTENIGYMEAKEASEIMQAKKIAAQKAIKEYKAAKREYNRIYLLAMTMFKTAANDGGY